MTPTGGPLHCVIHPHREAAARCSSCYGFFCRECVTEHDLRMLCARCLREQTTTPEKIPRRNHLLAALLAALPITIQLLAGSAILWLTFYLLGRCLVAIPSDFHEGSIWNSLTP